MHKKRQEEFTLQKDLRTAWILNAKGGSCSSLKNGELAVVAKKVSVLFCEHG